MHMKQLVIILLLSIIWSATVNAQTSTELFNSGLTKYKNKDYSGALQDLNRLLPADISATDWPQKIAEQSHLDFEMHHLLHMKYLVYRLLLQMTYQDKEKEQ